MATYSVDIPALSMLDRRQPSGGFAVGFFSLGFHTPFPLNLHNGVTLPSLPTGHVCLCRQVIATTEWGQGDIDGALRAAFLAVDANMQRDKVRVFKDVCRCI